MTSPLGAWKRRAASLLREPTVYFFAVGALLFVAHRLISGDPRVIVVGPGVKAELARRFQDHSHRAPSPAELEREVRVWVEDEALYREGVREGLDRDDAAVRKLVADRVRARAALAVANRQPSEADLDGWREAHRGQYETPRRYDYQYLEFPKTQRSAAAERDKAAEALARGDAPTGLGRPVIGGTHTADDLQERLGRELAARVQGLPVGSWHKLETDQRLLLVRLNDPSWTRGEKAAFAIAFS